MDFNGRLEITTRIGCRVNCKFCPQKKLLDHYKENSHNIIQKNVLSFKNFKKCIDKVPSSVRIDFSGMAEPWLNKDCTNDSPDETLDLLSQTPVPLVS
jgi:adenine C2-methylase RlmN of 23S rRNA A2503 and tRNA A37